MSNSMLSQLIENGLSFDTEDKNGEPVISSARVDVIDGIILHANITDTGEFYITTMLASLENDREDAYRLGFLTDVRGELSPQPAGRSVSSSTYFRLNLMISVLDGDSSDIAITTSTVLEKLYLASVITETIQEVQLKHQDDLLNKREFFQRKLDNEEELKKADALLKFEEENVAVLEASVEIITASLNYAQEQQEDFVLHVNSMKESFALSFNQQRKISLFGSRSIITHKQAAKYLEKLHISRKDAMKIAFGADK